jgi:hypothetical protein
MMYYLNWTGLIILVGLLHLSVGQQIEQRRTHEDYLKLAAERKLQHQHVGD